MRRRHWAGFAVLMLGLVGYGAAAAAADIYPSRPVRLIISFPPGGSTDTVGRSMQAQLERALGQPLVIENRGGAGGVIGLDAVAKAAPDGHTIGLGAAGALAINVSLREKMPFDPLTDLAPISGLGQSPFLLAAPLSSPFNTLREVIALAHDKPGSLSIGHGGNGTAMDLAARLLNHMAQVNITLVPYRGTGPATQDALAGHIPLAMTDLPSSFPFVQAKEIKVLGVTSASRVPTLPNVPTFAESGLPGYEAVGWFGFVAPAGTPAEIVAKLNAAIVTALQDAVVQDRIRAMGAEPMPFSPAEFAHYIRNETEKWAKVVAATTAQER